MKDPAEKGGPSTALFLFFARQESIKQISPCLKDEFQEETMTHSRLATACQPEHGLPLMLYLAVRHRFDLEAALLSNANAGGDNVHRGMFLRLLVGSALNEIPS
ncbi:MAG: ADP-ribosylglycohydrolase family protein [Desulfobacterales bacterium]